MASNTLFTASIFPIKSIITFVSETRTILVGVVMKRNIGGNRRETGDVKTTRLALIIVVVLSREIESQNEIGNTLKREEKRT